MQTVGLYGYFVDEMILVSQNNMILVYSDLTK